nr:phosphoadenosine phosphosulfate reductase family protein [Bacillus subtilis]
MIKQHYDDGKKHIHVLSYGGGTQSTALLLMALKGEINGVIPDYIIFSDTGWECHSMYTTGSRK